MSWEQVWDKYETQILEEMMEDCQEDRRFDLGRHDNDDNNDDDDDDDSCCVIDLNEISVREEITAQICLRILERSCVTNGMVDRLFLEEHDGSNNNNNNNDYQDKDSSSGKTDIVLDSSKHNNQHRGERNGPYKKKRRRRRRNAERDLARIRIRLERDIEDLLQSNHYQHHHSDGTKRN